MKILLIIGLIVVVGLLVWWYTPPNDPLSYAYREADKWKTTEDIIQGLHHPVFLVRERAIDALVEHPSTTAIKPLLEFIKDEDRRCGTPIWALMAIGPSCVPDIIKELVQTHEPRLIEIFTQALYKITWFPNKYATYYDSDEPGKTESIKKTWLAWWEQNNAISPTYWKKQALFKYRELLNNRYSGDEEAIEKLYYLTRQPFGKKVIETPIEDRPLINPNNNKARNEWFEKYGEVDKWIKWIDENYDYLYWSKEKDHFVVNEEAKTKGVSVNPETGKIIEEPK